MNRERQREKERLKNEELRMRQKSRRRSLTSSIANMFWRASKSKESEAQRRNSVHGLSSGSQNEEDKKLEKQREIERIKKLAKDSRDNIKRQRQLNIESKVDWGVLNASIGESVVMIECGPNNSAVVTNYGNLFM